jgi:hypothetical protein
MVMKGIALVVLIGLAVVGLFVYAAVFVHSSQAVT